MRFLIDAQLPRRLIFRFAEAGFDAIHTLDLPNGNRTTDAEIIALATREARVVVTKDSDFVNSFILTRQPPKLLLISTGNIPNSQLENLLARHLTDIASVFQSSDFLELTPTVLTVHT